MEIMRARNICNITFKVATMIAEDPCLHEKQPSTLAALFSVIVLQQLWDMR